MEPRPNSTLKKSAEAGALVQWIARPNLRTPNAKSRANLWLCTMTLLGGQLLNPVVQKRSATGILMPTVNNHMCCFTALANTDTYLHLAI